MRRADCPSGGLPWYGYAALCLLTVATLCLCVSLGSVAVPLDVSLPAEEICELICRADVCLRGLWALQKRQNRAHRERNGVNGAGTARLLCALA